MPKREILFYQPSRQEFARDAPRRQLYRANCSRQFTAAPAVSVASSRRNSGQIGVARLWREEFTRRRIRSVPRLNVVKQIGISGKIEIIPEVYLVASNHICGVIFMPRTLKSEYATIKIRVRSWPRWSDQWVCSDCRTGSHATGFSGLEVGQLRILPVVGSIAARHGPGFQTYEERTDPTVVVSNGW